MADDPTTSHPVTPEPQPAVPAAPGVAPSPTAAPTWSGAAMAPVQPVQPVATPAKPKSGSSGRWLNVLLGVALVFAIGGVAFAIGRTTAPAAAATGGRGNFNGGFVGGGNGPTGSFVPGANGGGFFGGRGAGGLSISGHRHVGGRRQADDHDRQRPDRDARRPPTRPRITRRPRPPRPTSTAGTRSRSRSASPAAPMAGPARQRRDRERRHDQRERRQRQRERRRRPHRDRVRRHDHPVGPRGRLTTMHLLVIEDDPRLSRLLRRLLEEDRHVVELATDGVSGVEIAAAAPGIDAIVLDVGLPDISGLEVARRVRASGSDVAILMLTARDTVGDRVSGLDAGADDYLVKPFAYEELAARLRALGRRGNGIAPARAEARRRADHPRRDRRAGDPRRQDRGPLAARVLAARVLPPPPRPDPVARPAPRPGLAVQRGGHAERGRRLRPLPAREAGRRPAA